jgi:hypothetical protein
MNFKIILLIVLSVLTTVVLMQNTDEVLFKILWKEVYVSKLVMMLSVTFFGFIIGIIVARPKKKIKVNDYPEAGKNIPLEINNPEDEYYIKPETKKGLSDEDRDYIS